MDYRVFSEGGPPRTSSVGTDYHWWTKRGSDAARSISDTLEVLKSNQARRNEQYGRSAELYGNIPYLVTAGLLTRKASVVQTNGRISYNVIASAIDTITSKIAKNRPRPLFLTSGGDYKLQRSARKLSAFVDGVFYENNAYRLGPEVFRDGAVGGTGIAHVFARHGRVAFERVHQTEIYVDEVEGFYGEPQNLHRVKAVDKGVLLAAMPSASGKIKAATPATDSTAKPSVSEMVIVRESWHLPSGPDKGDGRHVISIDDAVLFEEEWIHPFFPFAFFHWSKRLFGFWGQGAAERLQNIQREINRLLFVIQRSMHLAGSFKVFLQNGSKIVKEHVTNDIGGIISYTGQPPIFYVPQIVPPEIYNHLMTLKVAAFEEVGVSMLSAQSQKPAGLNSGKALREYNDIESDRFMTIGQAYENFFLDLARISIATVKDIVGESEKSYQVNAPNRRFLESIDWRDIELDESEYIMKCYPVSSLPTDPAGRLATVQEYVQAGFLTPRQGRRLMDFPDLEATENLANAAEEYITQVLEKIVDEGVMTPPDPHDDLELAHEMALEFYAQGRCQGLEDERLSMLLAYMSQVQALKNPAPAVDAGMPMDPNQVPMDPTQTTQPQGVAAPAQVSDLIANAPGVLQ